MMTIREETEKMVDDLVAVLGELHEERSSHDLVDTTAYLVLKG